MTAGHATVAKSRSPRPPAVLWTLLPELAGRFPEDDEELHVHLHRLPVLQTQWHPGPQTHVQQDAEL